MVELPRFLGGLDAVRKARRRTPQRSQPSPGTGWFVTLLPQEQQTYNALVKMPKADVVGWLKMVQLSHAQPQLQINTNYTPSGLMILRVGEGQAQTSTPQAVPAAQVAASSVADPGVGVVTPQGTVVTPAEAVPAAHLPPQIPLGDQPVQIMVPDATAQATAPGQVAVQTPAIGTTPTDDLVWSATHAKPQAPTGAPNVTDVFSRIQYLADLSKSIPALNNPQAFNQNMTTESMSNKSFSDYKDVNAFVHEAMFTLMEVRKAQDSMQSDLEQAPKDFKDFGNTLNSLGGQLYTQMQANMRPSTETFTAGEKGMAGQQVAAILQQMQGTINDFATAKVQQGVAAVVAGAKSAYQSAVKVTADTFIKAENAARSALIRYVTLKAEKALAKASSNAIVSVLTAPVTVPSKLAAAIKDGYNKLIAADNAISSYVTKTIDAGVGPIWENTGAPILAAAEKKAMQAAYEQLGKLPQSAVGAPSQVMAAARDIVSAVKEAQDEVRVPLNNVLNAFAERWSDGMQKLQTAALEDTGLRSVLQRAIVEAAMRHVKNKVINSAAYKRAEPYITGAVAVADAVDSVANALSAIVDTGGGPAPESMGSPKRYQAKARPQRAKSTLPSGSEAAAVGPPGPTGAVGQTGAARPYQLPQQMQQMQVDPMADYYRRREYQQATKSAQKQASLYFSQFGIVNPTDIYPTGGAHLTDQDRANIANSVAGAYVARGPTTQSEVFPQPDGSSSMQAQYEAQHQNYDTGEDTYTGSAITPYTPPMPSYDSGGHEFVGPPAPNTPNLPRTYFPGYGTQGLGTIELGQAPITGMDVLAVLAALLLTEAMWTHGRKDKQK